MKLSSLCNPPGIPKKLPLVIHTEGNCLYEEPCIRYLSLHIGQVMPQAKRCLSIAKQKISFAQLLFNFGV